MMRFRRFWIRLRSLLLVVIAIALAWHFAIRERTGKAVRVERPAGIHVIDGDTFVLDGEKIRLADVDAPEIDPPHCEREAALGLRAKARLGELLSAGPFELVPGRRDADQYGRKLRDVRRGGRSIGHVLVAEGLARRSEQGRKPWC